MKDEDLELTSEEREVYERNSAYAATTFCPLSGMDCNTSCVSFQSAYLSKGRPGTDNYFTLPFCKNIMVSREAFDRLDEIHYTLERIANNQ